MCLTVDNCCCCISLELGTKMISILYTSASNSISCTSTVRGTPIAYTIINQILEFQQNAKSVILQWIPSHIGIHGNEMVDSVAKRACVEGIPLNIVSIFSDNFYLLRKHCYKLWKEFHDERSREKGIWYITIQPEPLTIPWIDNCALDRKDIVTAMRLRSGHIPSRKFTFLMGITSSPDCEKCGLIEDVHHVLVECERGERLRRNLFGTHMIEFLSVCAVLVYLPLAVLSESLPQTRLIFYATLAVLAVFEILIGSLLIHGAFKRKPQFTWPWLVLAWWKGLVLLVLTVVGMVLLTFNRNVDTITEASAVISVYFVYSALLLYFAVVVNSRRQELVHENYWANKHMLRLAKTQYYYV